MKKLKKKKSNNTWNFGGGLTQPGPSTTTSKKSGTSAKILKLLKGLKRLFFYCTIFKDGQSKIFVGQKWTYPGQTKAVI